MIKNIFLFLSVLVSFSFARDKARDEPLEYLDSSISTPLWGKVINGDISKCELITAVGDSSEVVEWGEAKTFKINKFSRCKGYTSLEDYYKGSYKDSKGLYFLLEDSTGKSASAVRIILDTVVIEVGFNTSTEYLKKKGQWYIKENWRGGGNNYYSDPFDEGSGRIRHSYCTFQGSINGQDTGECVVYRTWITHSYYKAQDLPEFKYGEGSEYQTLSREFFNDYQDYSTTLTDECKVTCTEKTCWSTQVFPETSVEVISGEVTLDTISLDTVTSSYSFVKGKLVKDSYLGDTIVHTIDTAYINGYEGEETKITVILIKNSSYPVDPCSFANYNPLLAYRPISFFGSIDGTLVEGVCSPLDGRGSASCKYKDATGHKYGNLVGTEGAFIRSSPYLFKEGKTSEGKYKRGVRIGL